MGETADIKSLMNSNRVVDFEEFKPYLLILKIVLHGNLDEFNFKKDGIEVKGYFADVIKEEEVKELIIKFENNAGIIKRIPMCDIQVSEFKEVMDIDLVAPFIVAKH